jgi:HNH endonuclease/NUMOD4 motif-containing protein
VKDIPGYEGLYAITNEGQVWSYPKGMPNGMGHSGCWLRLHPHSAGYWRVTLTKDGKHRQFTVHRLVAKTYLPSPELHVNHKNGNKRDNRVENLEWVTTKENFYHAINSGMMPKVIYRDPPQVPKIVGAARGERNFSAKLTEAGVREIRELAAAKTFTYAQLGEMFGVDNAVVSRVVNRQAWAHVV